MIERKCLSCGTWNKDEDHCTNCGNPISPTEIVKVETKRKREEEANKPPDKFQVFADRMKNHKYFLMRVIYRIGYSIGVVFAALGAFFAWMVAMANG
jgi:ferredoxin